MVEARNNNKKKAVFPVFWFVSFSSVSFVSFNFVFLSSSMFFPLLVQKDNKGHGLDTLRYMIIVAF